jgi:hypothetical protein
MKNQQDEKLQKDKQNKQTKQGAEECDYLHPEQCEKHPQNDLDETKKAVQEIADDFIKEENESKEG